MINNQTTSTVLMIRPSNFGFNPETAASNSFQNEPKQNSEDVQAIAKKEFDNYVNALTDLGVDVIVFDDFKESSTPDSIFPNNWISTHQNGSLIVYPMFVPNRRKERRMDIIDSLRQKYNYKITDFSPYELGGTPQILEGTGSMIFDHSNKVVYAATSPRTNPALLTTIAKHIEYIPVVFEAMGKSNELIYHTNVMMCVGDTFISIGLDTIIPEHREAVLNQIKTSGKEIVALTNDQVYNHFAGNMLQVKNKSNESILVMSEQAYNSLTEEQLAAFKKHNNHLLAVSIPTIEYIGGGSARCMLAEIFY